MAAADLDLGHGESVIIRDAAAADETAWRELWEGYNAFYGAEISERVTDATWARILDPDVPMFARLAAVRDGAIGFSISLVHDSTWTIAPVLYLEDLFVHPAERGHGIGEALIRDLIELASERGMARMYWHTHEANPARALYDRFSPADSFVRYRLNFEPD